MTELHNDILDAFAEKSTLLFLDWMLKRGYYPVSSQYFTRDGEIFKTPVQLYQLYLKHLHDK